VRKAFLNLDTDHDGFISCEDILRYFGSDTELNINHLKKILNDKSSNSQGMLTYQDFSKWVGNSIHSLEGFYFRHDSIKNPYFERNLMKYEKMRKHFNSKQKRQNMEKPVMDKIRI